MVLEVSEWLTSFVMLVLVLMLAKLGQVSGANKRLCPLTLPHHHPSYHMMVVIHLIKLTKTELLISMQYYILFEIVITGAPGGQYFSLGDFFIS